MGGATSRQYRKLAISVLSGTDHVSICTDASYLDQRSHLLRKNAGDSELTVKHSTAYGKSVTRGLVVTARMASL